MSQLRAARQCTTWDSGHGHYLADPPLHALSAMLMSSAHGSAHAWPPRSTSLLAVRLPTATQCTCPARQALLDGQLDATLLNPPFTILVS